MTGLRIIVCGGRDYADRTAVYRMLDRLHLEHGISAVSAGDGGSAGRFAKDWARTYRVLTPNQEAYPDFVLAFPGYVITDQARQRGVRVVEAS